MGILLHSFKIKSIYPFYPILKNVRPPKRWVLYPTFEFNSNKSNNQVHYVEDKHHVK